jgi:glycosyltransferase involved in cell wall biosynthesis
VRFLEILVSSIIDLKNSQHNRPHQILKYLSQNHNVTVISINDWWKKSQGDLENYSSAFNNDFNKVKFFHLTEKKISPILQEVFSISAVNKILKDDFDVHLNYSTLISGYFPTKKLKTVYDLADDLGSMIRESPQIPSLLRPAGGYFGDFMVKTNIKNSSQVTVTTKSLMTSYRIPKEKCAVIPNGVDTNLFKNYGDHIKQKIGIDGFIIGYVGVLREWVDLESVFSVLRNLDEGIKMIVVGKEGDYEVNVKLAEKYGLSERVIFTGMVPYSDVPKYISAMDVCLIPFKTNAISKNALPLKLFEYMACEKPVISSDIPGVRNVAGNTVMFATTKEEYKEAILKLYRNEDLRLRMGSEGRKLVECNYNWESIVKKMEGILLNVGDLT